MPRLKALFILDASSLELCYGEGERQAIAQRVELIAPPMTQDNLERHPHLLNEVQVIFSGWGAPVIDEAFLNAAPRLRAVFYAGGGVGSWITQAVWDRGIVVTSAYAANAIPVAEYALGVTLFSLKHGWLLSRQTRATRSFPARDGAPGCYGSTVGLISLGVTARAFRRLLRGFDLRVLAYDPYVSATEEQELDVEGVALDELFRRADVVSLHAPLLSETEGMITGRHLASMKAGATFINSARGGIVRQDELIEVARQRPDLQFVLDVVDPEPPPADSPLYGLENVMLTPHIAGSTGAECRRMGRYMIDELDRYLAGKPLHWAVTPQMAAVSIHRPMRGNLRVTLPARRHELADDLAPQG